MGSLRGDRDVLMKNTFEGGCLFKRGMLTVRKFKFIQKGLGIY